MIVDSAVQVCNIGDSARGARQGRACVWATWLAREGGDRHRHHQHFHHHHRHRQSVTVIGIITIEIFTYEFWTWPATWAQIKTFGGPGGTKNMSLLKTRLKECDLRCNVIAEKIRHLFTFMAWPSFLRNCKWVQVSPPFVFVSTKIPRDTTNPVFLPERQCNEFNITWNWNVQCLVQRY